jgi:hypothetical protein
MQSTGYSCYIIRKTEFFRQIFEKYWSIKLHEKPASGSRVVAGGQTDGHDEANSRFQQFFERAYKEPYLIQFH